MEKKQQRQMSESLLVGSLLAIVGGYLDAYTYLVRGGVFSNAQTGNIVLMGMSLAEGHFLQAFNYFTSIFAFVVGILVAEGVKFKYKAYNSLHWRQIIIALEIVVLLAVGIFFGQDHNDIANICVAAVCAIQVEGFRKLHGNPYATTMCTGNLRSATEKLFWFGLKKDDIEGRKSKEYYSVILCFILGVMLGGVATPIFLEKAVLIAVAILCVVFGILFWEEEII